MNVNSIIMRFSSRGYSDPREEAIRVFQKYRRHIESDRNNLVECMSCGRIIHMRDAKGGYYISPEESSAVEFESDNMWPQCPYCISSLEGNKKGFRKKLVSRIGADRVKRLELMRDASAGSIDAYKKLSKEDRLKAMSNHNRSYYEYKKCEYESLERLYSRDERVSI